MLVFIGKRSLSSLRWVPMCQGFNSYSGFLHHFAMAKLATSSIWINVIPSPLENKSSDVQLVECRPVVDNRWGGARWAGGWMAGGGRMNTNTHPSITTTASFQQNTRLIYTFKGWKLAPECLRLRCCCCCCFSSALNLNCSLSTPMKLWQRSTRLGTTAVDKESLHIIYIQWCTPGAEQQHHNRNNN